MVKICDRLAALTVEFKAPIEAQLNYVLQSRNPTGQEATGEPSSFTTHSDISALLMLLQRHEYDLKDDMRSIVYNIQAKLGAEDVEGARQYALKVQAEISASIDQIKMLALKIAGSSQGGAFAILTTDDLDKAEVALNRYDRVLILNMFFVVIALALGAVVFQHLAVYQFILVSGFAVTSVTVVNAFHLKSTEALSEKGFLQLMQLALLKFFAPLTAKKSRQLGLLIRPRR